LNLQAFSKKQSIKIPPKIGLVDDSLSNDSDEDKREFDELTSEHFSIIYEDIENNKIKSLNQHKVEGLSGSFEEAEIEIVNKSDTLLMSNSNYENLYELQNLFSSFTKEFEKKNYKYNKLIHEWFEIASTADFLNLEVNN